MAGTGRVWEDACGAETDISYRAFHLAAKKNRETIQVVAAKNSQAKNISTSEVKAKTLHTASAMRLQKLVNSLMGAGTQP